MNHAERATRRKAVADAIASGAPLSAVCEQFGCTSTFVYNCCAAHGVRFSRRGEDRAKILALAREGVNRREIADAVGWTETGVVNVCRRNGIEVRPGVRSKHGVAGKTLRIIAALFDRGKTYQMIARDFGVTRQRVQQVYADAMAAGIPLLERSAAVCARTTRRE